MAHDERDGLARALKGTVTGAVSNVAQIGRALESVLRLPGLRRDRTQPATRQPGSPAGIDHVPDIDIPPDEAVVRISTIDYSPDRAEESTHDGRRVAEFLASPRPAWAVVRWINVDGLHPHVVDQLRRALGFHTLAAEDVLHVPQRPAVEAYPDHTFLKTRVLRLEDDLLVSEQVTMFLFEGVLLTFQERPGDVWEPVRERARRSGSRMRTQGPDFLMYALLDGLVDHCFPLLERYGDRLEEMESSLLDQSEPEDLRNVQRIRRELMAIRRVLWPTRELVDQLIRNEMFGLTEHTRLYLRDVYSHAVQCIDIVESQREMCSGLSDLYLSTVSNRMNEIMKVLTIMSALFIPLTFLAGVYGMNFEHMPELGWPAAYPTFWVACGIIVTGLLVYFRRKGWI